MAERRPTSITVFTEIAMLIATRGTCKRAKVGCVIVKDGRIISIGYNGAPSKLKHCTEVGCDLYKDNCRRATHAELNAIAFAAKRGMQTLDSTMFCTDAPCFNCSHAIIAAGVKEVFYIKNYHDEGLALLKSAKIKVKKLHRSGDSS